MPNWVQNDIYLHGEEKDIKKVLEVVKSDVSEFDFNKFVKYCKAIDVPVEQALADIITTDLLIKRFPAYAEAKGKNKQQQIDEAFAELPKSMKKQLATLNEKAIADNKTMINKGVFGSFDKDVYMKTTYGEEN